jgi:hypothetical protein
VGALDAQREELAREEGDREPQPRHGEVALEAVLTGEEQGVHGRGDAGNADTDGQRRPFGPTRLVARQLPLSFPET